MEEEKKNFWEELIANFALIRQGSYRKRRNVGGYTDRQKD
jgi:hypothetical protein